MSEESSYHRGIIDGTGFTSIEKHTLINVWNILKAKRKKHANEIHIRFFVAHPWYLKYFKIDETTYNNEMLHAHAAHVFAAFGSLIEEGLFNTSKFNMILSNFANHHKVFSEDDKEAFINIVSVYFKEVLERYMSPSLERTLEKFLECFTRFEVQNFISKPEK